ncbi:hypothetical protein BD414DRAFT_425179 [Trametes punicea]|nr:hypothetical protein BD414DRAFT_425179 [Trametes punicea]
MQNKGQKIEKRAAEALEVEDEEQRQERMHALLSRLNAASSTGPNSGTPLQRPLSFGDGSAFPAGPSVDLLQRVQAFLPELAASNAELLRRARENPESVDIENVGEDQEQYIEMNLGLGVFEHRGELPPGIPVANVDLDASMDDADASSDSGNSGDESFDTSSSSSDSASVDSSEESSSAGDSDSDVNIIASSKEKQEMRPMKPLPRRKSAGGQKPDIVVLSETVQDLPSST